ncbi:Chromosome partition protein Smc [Pseudomonas sp. THAF187a]|uniref:tape measure protein n=1 Tax=unclassified Pseudomonas TaxID=196821 RepID=UPI0012A9DB1E|nr:MULTISPECIES: tape measure protein [unclassified Pseudomonas]QFT23565.1 Chromosome partition protein Smc [Pseudomonas sp. THAF187a]QFT43753.1 Chromosome partition protein Smc [Pseudomonas sp. THAF42]
MTDVELKLTADVGQATKEVAGFRREYAELVRSIEKPLRQIDALKETQQNAKAASSAYFEAKRRVDELKRAIEQAGQPVRQLDRAYAQAQRTLANATREFDRQKAKVREQRAELQAAGVDTRNLAAEQQRLQSTLAKGLASGRNDQAIRTAAQDLGVGRYRAAQVEVERLRGQYQLLRTSGNLTARELAVAQQALTQRVRETQQAIRGVNTEQQRSRIGGGAAALAAQAGGAYGAFRGLQGVIRIADNWVELTDRIKLASGSQEEYAQGMERLRDISDRTFTDMRGNAENFVNSLAPLRDRGFSNDEVLSFVEAVGLGMVASAARGERAAAALQQFSNALQDGKLQGDAFTAMIRTTPALADALTRSLGLTREELAKMATEGQLTTDVWVPAVISQLDSLGGAVDGMNILVSDALTRLNNAWEDAIGKADTKPLVAAIEDLTKTIGDPLIVENLVKIASAMVYLASVAVSAASGFAELGDNIGYAAAKASGNVDKLTKLEKTLKEVNNAITGDSFIGSNTVAVLMKQFAPEGLVRWRKELEEEIAKVGAELSGMSLEAYKAQQETARQQREAERQALDEQKKLDQQEVAAKREKFSELAKLRDAEVKASADAVKARAKAEREALKELDKAKQAQLDTETRYKEALDRLRSDGAGGEASFGNAMSLRVAARQALEANDFERAKKNAQAALKMLLDLADAGENTYGFEGFIKSLKDIEDQADKVSLDKAKSSFEQAQKQTADLKTLLDELKDTTITVTMDQTALDKVYAQLAQLAQATGRALELPDLPAANTQPTPAGNIKPPVSKPSSPAAAPAQTQIRQTGPNSFTNVPAVDAEVRVTGIRQDGPNSWTNLPPVDVAVTPQGIRQDGANSWTNLPPVEVGVLPKGIRQDGENSFTNLPPVDVELQVDQEAATQAQQQVAELAQRFKRELVIPVTPVAGQAGATSAGQVDGYADGGLIRGPGTGTSDSILARLSNGEFVMRADAVRHYGSALLQRLNSRQLPRFADGGLVSSALAPSVPMAAQQLERTVEASRGPDLSDYGYLGLDLGGGQTHEVLVHKTTEMNLRRLANKFGPSMKRR